MKHLSPQPVIVESHTTQKQDLRNEIATIAARFIAEDGATYAIAKQKAAQQVLGSSKINHDSLPDNSLIEQQVRLYNQLFFADSQPARLLYLRKLALTLLQELEQFNPHLTGAVLNGTAGEHSEIFIQLFVDNNKEVAIYLLNQRIQFEVSETLQGHQSRQQEAQETLSFMRANEVIHLVLFASDDVRRLSTKKMPRANASALQHLIEESLPT
ncbi:hypothetical protein [Solimicrobium silvestre]|uniref:Uncharacterized protein n=1 Tax=Solimicrobium silvestre TaxID=2099400 RepID=A0A2S9GUF7_9BURK|nr:hypothetical protein [Solimicrobium silvestre]PRC91344.1 hypothetical protein S2091_3889 [Solimicrobium silvestre]